MPVKQFIVISRAKPGTELAFDEWYDSEHLPDIVAVPGVMKATRYRVVSQEPTAFDSPTWYSVAIYELDAENPRDVLAEINARAQRGEMLISDAIDAEVLLQLMAEPTRSVERPSV
jgi:hypothetical protein